MKLKTKLSKLRHDGHITDAEYAIIINVLNKFATQLPKTQTCEDCISREAVIRLVEQYPVIIGNRYSGLIADIKHLPPVTPFTQWTPASQLPEPNTAVLLYVKYKSSGQWTYQLGMWDDNKLAWEDWRTPYQLEEEFEVIAWMELPEKYEEDNDEW